MDAHPQLFSKYRRAPLPVFLSRVYSMSDEVLSLTEQLEALGWRLKLIQCDWREGFEGKIPEVWYWCKDGEEIIFEDALRAEGLSREKTDEN